MFKNWFSNWFKKNTPEKIEEDATPEKEMNSFLTLDSKTSQKSYDTILNQSISKTAVSHDGTQDTANQSTLKPFGGFTSVNEKQFDYFSRQGFIGFNTCSIIAQHWLVNKGVTIPAKDAIRNGYELTFNDGEKVDIEFQKKLRKLDKKYRIRKNLVEYVKFGRIFGIRIAIFKVESEDPEYYTKPFNIDGVRAGSYKGISQVDPYWVTPYLTTENVNDPSSIGFYEPTYWWISGVKYHKSHLSIMTTDEVSDVLKPSYFYAGISIPQKIMNRVYSSEKTADEAPLLTQTKRTNIYKTNLNTVKTNVAQLKERLLQQSLMQDNYGTRVIGTDDEVTQLDTSLADVDAVIMTQFQIVAGELNVPISKLLGTPMKGFSSGEKEQDDYYEELENIQDYDMTELLDRHYELSMKSDFKTEHDFEITWNPLQVQSPTEKATIRETNSRTDLNNVTNGSISPAEVRERLIKDIDSGYDGLEIEEIEEIENDLETKEKEETIGKSFTPKSLEDAEES